LSKIINLGFQKTGTSSIEAAMRILGYSVCSSRPEFLFPILNQQWDVVFTEADNYDCLSDHPWPQLLEQLDERYLGAKYILTEREIESWFKSVNHHIGNKKEPLHAWLYGRKGVLPAKNKHHVISVYQAHNQKIKDYFTYRRDDLLVIKNPTDFNWRVLCSFLNKEIPNEEFPHKNASNYEKANRHQGGGLSTLRKKWAGAAKVEYMKWKGWI